MKKVTTYLLLGITVFTLFGFDKNKDVSVRMKDIERLNGSWKGTLTYLDYTTGKPYTMPADVIVSRIGNSNSFAFSHSYPEEVEANASDTLVVSADGTYLNNEKVTARRKLPKGALEIVTQEKGTDGNDDKSAVFRFTHTISSEQFVKTKEVQFAGTNDWIKRHEYIYKKG